MTNTALFHRTATNYATQFQVIADAYTLAGLKPPTRALDIKKLVNDESQNVYQTAARLGREALLTDQDPATWYQNAVEQIKEAQAREALAAAFNRSYTDAVNLALPRLLEEATGDLAPVAARAVKDLTAAVKTLPAGTQALDSEAAISLDAGAALTKARKALALLGTLASIYQLNTPGEVPPALNILLPVVALPAATKEQVAKSYGESVKVLNERQLTSTRAIRSLADTARTSLDLALVNVARGQYEGITLALATPQEMQERRRNATLAHQRESIAEDGRVYVS